MWTIRGYSQQDIMNWKKRYSKFTNWKLLVLAPFGVVTIVNNMYWSLISHACVLSSQFFVVESGNIWPSDNNIITSHFLLFLRTWSNLVLVWGNTFFYMRTLKETYLMMTNQLPFLLVFLTVIVCLVLYILFLCNSVGVKNDQFGNVWIIMEAFWK